MVDSPSPPPAPDPVATANAQGAMNRETAYTNYALSRVNQTSPWGSQTWSRNTNTAGGKAWDQYERDYTAWSQRKADAGTKGVEFSEAAPVMPDKGIEDSWTLNTALTPAQQGLLDSTQRIGQTALNTGEAQLNRAANSLSTPLNADGLPNRIMAMPYSGHDQIFDVAPTSGAIKYDPGYSGVADLKSQAGDIQRRLDFSGLPNLPGINDFGNERLRVEDALYQRAASRLDPQWQQAETDLRTDLANRGITEGSAAWNSELDRLNRSKTDAYQNATWNAIGAGGSEQSRIMADALRARQQGFTETTTGGQFANTAQAQAYDQLSTDRNRYTNELDRLLTANNSAQQQEFGQNLAAMQARNAAVGQQWGIDRDNVDFWNRQRDASLTERATLRNQPLNDLRGLMGLGTVQAPQFGQVATPQMASPDLMGATYASYNGQANAANAAAANQTAMFNGLMGLGGSAMTAFALSDRRAKKDVTRIGAADNGVPIYTYRYTFDDPNGPLRVGAMAQEVEKIVPAAVAEIGGVKMVDYSRAFGEPRA